MKQEFNRVSFMQRISALIILITIPSVLLGADYQKQAFQFAVMESWPLILKWVKQKNIDVNILSAEGNTLLSLAVRQRNEEAVNSLIKAGADVNAGQPAPLTQALINLVRNPQATTAITDTYSRIIAKLVQSGAIVKEQDWILLKAIRQEQAQDIVNRILSKAKHKEDRPRLEQPAEEPLVPKVTNKIVVALPNMIAEATKIKDVRLNLDKIETFTQESFKELIDNDGGSHIFVVALSKDNNNRWYAHVYDREQYKDFAKTKVAPLSPLNRLEVKYTQPVIIVRENGTYSVRTQ